MTIVALDPATGAQLARVPISNAVPGAQANYGYSETSAPICADNRLIVGAAGSEYGARGFVMAYKTPDARAGVARPVLDDPAERHRVAHCRPHRRRWRRLDTDDGRPDHEHPLHRHRRRDASVLPVAAARARPARGLDHRDQPGHRADEVVAAAAFGEPVVVRHLAAADGLHGEDRRQADAHRLGRDDGGRLVRLQRRDRRADLPAREGDRQRRAPEPQAGSARRHLSLVARRPQLLARRRSTRRPATSTTPPRRRRPCSSSRPRPRRSARRCSPATCSSGSQTATTASTSRSGWKDYGSVSAIDVATGKRVWKFDTPQPERGGPTTTASGLGFVGGGDGNLRAFDVEDRPGALDVPDGLSRSPTGPRSTRSTAPSTSRSASAAPRPRPPAAPSPRRSRCSISAAARAQSTPPDDRRRRIRQAGRARRAPRPGRLRARRTAPTARRQPRPPTSRLRPGLFVQTWNANTSNTSTVTGHVMLERRSRSPGAVVTIGGWAAAPTDSSGAFQYPVDITTPGRHVATVTDVAPRDDRRQAAHARRSSDRAARPDAGISVGYQVSQRPFARRRPTATSCVTGRLSYGDSTTTAPPTVLLYSYELKGTITDANGNPVAGRDRDHADERPAVLDAVTADGGERRLRLVPRRGRPGGRRPGADGGRDRGRQHLVRRAGSRSDHLREAEERRARRAAARPLRAARSSRRRSTRSRSPARSTRASSWASSAGKGGVIKPISATWPDAGGQLPARAPELRQGPDRELLGGRAAVLLDPDDEAGRARRPDDLSEVAAGRRAPGPRDASSSPAERSRRLDASAVRRRGARLDGWSGDGLCELAASRVATMTDSTP